MSEDVARAVGAASPTTVKVCGKECQPRPLTIKELTELQRDCLAKYRRSYVEAYSQNVDFLPEDERRPFIREKIEEAAKMDLSSLPRKDAYDARRVVLTPELEKWLEENIIGYKRDEKDKEGKVAKRIVVGSLDAELLSLEEYEKLTKQKIKPTKVGYVDWWVTGSFEGMISMINLVFKGCGVTEDELCREVSRNPALLMNLSREIEHLSAPEVGNG